MERAGLDDLVIVGFRFFSTLLGVRVASFPAAALRAVGHGFVFVSLAPRWVLLLLRSGASARVARCWELARGWREVATSTFLAMLACSRRIYKLWRLV